MLPWVLCNPTCTTRRYRSPRASPRPQAPKSLWWPRRCGLVHSPEGPLVNRASATQVDCGWLAPKRQPVAVDVSLGVRLGTSRGRYFTKLCLLGCHPKKTSVQTVPVLCFSRRSRFCQLGPACHPKMTALASPPTLLPPEGVCAAGFGWLCFVHRFPHSFHSAVVRFAGPRISLRLPALFHTRGCGLQPLGSARP
jgi:hypothetical protein